MDEELYELHTVKEIVIPNKSSPHETVADHMKIPDHALELEAIHKKNTIIPDRTNVFFKRNPLMTRARRNGVL